VTLHDSPRAGIVYIVGDSSILTSNMVQPIPGGWGSGLLFGFSQGMLGVTGFETAANYIEEQRKGVYVKTLRNMWWCVRLLTLTPRPKPFTRPTPAGPCSFSTPSSPSSASAPSPWMKSCHVPTTS